MPVFFLPESEEDRRLAPLIDKWMRREHYAPCWLCKRESRKTPYSYMCWECQETRPIWEAHLHAIQQAEYEREAAAYVGPCMTCAQRLAAGDFECVTCRKEWEN